MTGIKRMIRKIFAAKKEVDIEDAVEEIAARMAQLSIETIIISDMAEDILRRLEGDQ